MCDDYSEKMYEEIIEKVEVWIDQFKAGDLFAQLSDDDKEVAPFVIDSFTTFMYNYIGLSPEGWQWEGVEEFFLNITSRKVLGEKSYFKTVISVLGGFFRFLDQKEILENANRFAYQVERIESKASDSDAKVDDFIESYDNDGLKSLDKTNEEKLEKEHRLYIFHHDNLMEKLKTFFYETKEEYAQILSDYYLDFVEVMTEKEEELSEELKSLFLQLVLFDYKVDGERNLITLFWDEKKEGIHGHQKEILRECLDIRLSIYEVIDIEANNTYLVKDYMKGNKFIVREEAFDYLKGDIILGRITQVWGEQRIFGPVRKIPADYSYIIFDEVKEALSVYRREGRDKSIGGFLKSFSSNLLAIAKEVNKLMQDYEKVYEARYKIQSASFTKNKLISNPKIEVEFSLEGLDHLVWLSDSGDIYGDFMIEGDYIFFRSHDLEYYNEGKKIIKDLLVFTALLEDEYIVDLESGNSSEDNKLLKKGAEVLFVDKFINTPLDEVGFVGEKPIEMIENKKGRQLINRLLDRMELGVTFMGGDHLFNLDNIAGIRKRLGLETEGGVLFKDDVEILLAQTMVDYFDSEEAYNSINLWRVYKKKVDKIRGRAKSWAAGVAYLLSSINDWGYTQKELGEKYGVTPTTISNKYRKLEVFLENEINDIMINNMDFDIFDE